MGFVLTYSSKVRQALKAPGNIGIDVLVMLSVAGFITGLGFLTGHVASAREQAVTIDLSVWALPKYTFYSLSRGFAAYGISLLFTLVYGTISAHNRVAEKFMLPILDVLQSIPVLSFLPVLVLSMVHLFPASWLGLELACVIMIFTAQAWNMTFSYHGSVRAIPNALREAGEIQHFSGWQTFRYLEVPSSMIGLVWNSMMSMAGGWFIITVNEAFTLNGQDYRLPGLGSYMNQALAEWNTGAMIAGVIAMILMIVFVDQLFWRPIVVWSQKFKLEDTASADAPESWVLDLLQRSPILNWVKSKLARRHEEPQKVIALSPPPGEPPVAAPVIDYGRQKRQMLIAGMIKWSVLLGLAILAFWGAWRLVHLLLPLHFRDTPDSKGWGAVLLALGFSFFRVTAAVLIGALWTVPAGVLIGLSPKWSSRLQPIIQIVASFPSPMLYPLVIIVLVKLGIPFTLGCIALMLLGTQWYTLFNVIAGAMAIPSDLREAGEIYHLTSWQKWTRIYLPAIFPYLVTGLITAAGGAWNATIVSEYILLPHKDADPTTYEAFGLGSIISDATAAGNYSLLTASVVVMGIFVVLLNRIVWKRIYRVAEDRYTLNT
jgi:NitT/TauT family transport system permease protein